MGVMDNVFSPVSSFRRWPRKEKREARKKYSAERQGRGEKTIIFARAELRRLFPSSRKITRLLSPSLCSFVCLLSAVTRRDKNEIGPCMQLWRKMRPPTSKKKQKKSCCNLRSFSAAQRQKAASETDRLIAPPN